MMIIQEERGWPAAPGTSPGDSRVQLTFHRPEAGPAGLPVNPATVGFGDQFPLPLTAETPREAGMHDGSSFSSSS